MTEYNSSTTNPGMTGRARDILKRGAAVAPYMRYAPRHPALLIGAAVVGLAGMLAWRNREKIRAKAGPMLQSAMDRGGQMKQRLPWSRATGTPAGMQESLH